jgi:Fuc2NAc and GlcNAc transferase
MFTLVALATTVFIVSFTVTYLARRYALRFSLVDIPNQRSSHQVPTPRGGGVGVAVALLGAVGYLFLTDNMPRDLGLALLAGGTAMSIVGWWDDHRPLPAWFRLLLQSGAAFWTLFLLGGLPEVEFGIFVWRGGMASSLLTLIAMVWLINLYNFMDGSDGLAGVQAIWSATVGAALFVTKGQLELTQLSYLLALACLGFLCWNWPPAKIFLGDIGSYLIGFALAVLAVAGEQTASVPALVWTILLAPFVWDATTTLVYRGLRGERWYDAHRSHAYQLLIQSGWSHRRVVWLYLSLNIACLPLVWLGQRGGPAMMIAALVALIVILTFWSIVRQRARTAGLPS